MKRVFKNKQIVIGGTIVLLMILLVVFAPLLTKYDYSSVDMRSRQAAPSAEHFFGTDMYGRDVWTRVIYGGRISLTVAVGASLIAMTMGTLIGTFSGYIGGAFDFVTGRVMDVFMAFPPLLFSLVIGLSLGASVRTMFFSIGIPCIPMFYRMARSTTMSVRERSFVAASRTMGCSRRSIVFGHIIPNVLPHILVVFSSAMGSAILAESSLGFLGFGIPQPTPSWGLVVNEGKRYMFDYPWTTAFAGLFIALTVFSFNLLGDGIRDLLDPRIRSKN